MFKSMSIPFFRHVTSDEGVKPDPAKLDAIRNMPSPTLKHKILSFLGLCNYLSTYVPNLSSILQPLHELTKKNAAFTWEDQYEKLYKRSKNHILEEANTLCYYDPDLPLSLEMDASQSGLEAVLLQGGRPISFMSRPLTEMQSRYSNIGCEILGIVTGVEHFHQYLFGINFMLFTDHKPIENLVLKPLVETLPRIQQLLL